MKMLDLHPEKQEVVLLLPPMLATAQMMKTLLADPMGGAYRFLIPDLSGHGEAADALYPGAAQEAAAIAAYLHAQGIEKIQLAFGASLGSAVLMALLQQPGLSFERLFLEGSSFYEHADLLTRILRPILIKKHRIAAAHPDLAVKKIGMLYGDSVKAIMAGQMIGISEQSLAQIVYDCGHVCPPKLSPEQQKNTVFAYGEKDSDLKIARKRIPQLYPDAQLIVWPGEGHCMKITKDSARYAAMLKGFIDGRAPQRG